MIWNDIVKDKTIGVITPYRNQAKLIQKMIDDDKKIKSKISVNTVHSFQGGEFDIVIFDSVEGDGAKKWSIIKDSDKQDAHLLLNVAITRAKCKLYVVSNKQYIDKCFEASSFFRITLNEIVENGISVLSTSVFSTLKDENYDKWIDIINARIDEPIHFGNGFSHDEFWPSFHNDLLKAKSELIIFSPFLTSERLGKLQLLLISLLKKNIKIYIVTLSPKQAPAIMNDTPIVISKLKELGICVKFRNNMHEKIAIIDRNIKWIGSLNILSHNTRTEYMERFEGEKSAKELFDRFELEDLLMKPNINGEKCPSCASGFIETKYNQRQKKYFYGCSGFPDCDFTAEVSITALDQINYHQTKKTNTVTKSNMSQKVTKSRVSKKHVGEDEYETSECYWRKDKAPGFTYAASRNEWYKKKK